MMMQDYNPDDYLIEWGHEYCPFHKENPNEHYAGCTCTGWYTMRRKSEEEKEEEKRSGKRGIRDRS